MLSAVAAWFMPVGKLPPLTGRYKQISVTTKYLSAEHIPSLHAALDTDALTDELKNNPFVGQYNDTPMRLVARFYYPSAYKVNPAHTPLAYTNSYVAAATARFAHIPSFIMQPLTLMKLRSAVDLPCVQTPEKLPVVLFSHGLGGHSDVYANMCEDLASHGYLVVAPTHNDNSACISQLPNDETVEHHYLTKAEAGSHVAVLIRQAQLLRRVREMTFLGDYINYCETNNAWSEVLSKSVGLSGINQSQTFNIAGRFNLNRIATVGHSFGGVTAVSYAQLDKRVCACVAHDVWLLPIAQKLLQTGCTKPLLQTVSEHFYRWSENWISQQTLTAASRRHHSDDKCLVFTGTRHSNFSDVGGWNPRLSRMVKAIGKLDENRAFQLFNTVQVLYLNEQLGITDNVVTMDKKPITLQQYIEAQPEIKQH